MKLLIILVLLATLLYRLSSGCQFYPSGEYLRFVRVPENLTVGSEVLKVEVYPRRNLSIRPVDKEGDVIYFNYKDVNRTTVSVVLAKPLEDLVDSDIPQNVLKFRLVCDFNDGEDTISSYLSITVYVEDINDHSPVFINAPYQINVDELTPVGMNIFRGILAVDEDKPNTPNSEVQYSIVGGNERGRFSLDSSHKPILQVKKALDYDTGDREFILTIQAIDRGVPSRSTNTTIKILVNDNDDLPPKFTKGVYRTRITEFYPITGKEIHHPLKFDSPIYAFDQDMAIDSPIRYDIIAGNDRGLFALDISNGTLFLEREIDLDQERSLPGNTFVLQIQASQVDNPLKMGVARVEVEVMDLNDNLPEFEVDFYNISIVENLPNGFSVLQVVATDQDQGDNGEFMYMLDDESGAFNLDQRTGWLTVRDQSHLDRETQSSIKLNVSAKEKSPSVVKNKDGQSAVSIEVTLLDANDNNPTFVPNNLYEFMVSSEAKVGDVVGTVKAVDPDMGRNGVVFYDIQKTGNISNLRNYPFAIEPKTGRVIISETPLTEGRHALFIEASDQPANPSERRYSLAVVTVEVTKPGNKGSQFEVPNFVGAPYEFWVGGNVGIGTSVGQIRLNDALSKKPITYDLLHSYPEGVPFAVEERSGVITVVDELAKFDRPIYDFEAVVTDEKTLTLVTNVTVHVVDPQDERGILMKGAGSSPIEFRVKENQAKAIIGPLLHKNVTIKSLRFIIANQQDVTDDIAITNDGTLFTQKALDREQRDTYRLTVIAQYSRGVISGAGIYQVTVYVDDENDNPPVFDHTSYEGVIKENCISGTEVELNYPVRATDADIGGNALFSVAIFGEGSEMFRIDKHTGKIIFNSGDSPLDREEKSTYDLRLLASDKGGLVSEAKLKILVLDENDNAPVFLQMIVIPDQGVEVVEYDESRSEITVVDEKNTNYSSDIISTSLLHMRKKENGKILAPLLSLPENIPIGTPILKLIADDRDIGENAHLRYEMASETYIPNSDASSNTIHVLQYFMVHSLSGEISVARALPPESEFRLNISASDGGGLHDNVMIRIHVKDINDHAPVFKKSFYNFDAEEALYSRTILGKIDATDMDYAQNANISYFISNEKYDQLPFTISEFSGVLSVNGELDRETQDKFTFKVIAQDNAEKNAQLSSSVDVEVNVLDLNDNSPEFYGYDELIPTKIPETEIHPNHNFDSTMLIPVYYANVVENSPIGTPITRVFANDSDFSGNGNGLFLFNIPQRKNKENYFAVDSKDGVVTTVSKLDFEYQSTHNLTIIASDLGSPSLSSTALVIVSVIDVPDEPNTEEKQIFSHRYYEVEVEENIGVPVSLLTLNLTDIYQPHRLRFTIVAGNDKEIARMFKVQPRNGTVYITESPDREKRDKYEFKIRLDRIKFGRGMPVMVYPITSEKLTGLALNEVKVIVKITDMNDNEPKFTFNGRPIVAALPSGANFGYQILKLQAKDPDIGANGEVRYQILGRADDESHRFAIDPVTGQVRSVANFARDAGKVYGFDVKATDRRGADDGKSAIANVFVYVIDERKQLVMVLDSKPTDVEHDMENITLALFNATGYDVRVRKLEPHAERNQVDYSATDMYIYAVDPHLNVIIDMDRLQKVLHSKQLDIERQLEPHRVLEIASGVNEVAQSRSQRFLLSTLEVGVVVLGCVVFVGALATALCVTCVKRNKRKQQKKYPKSQFTSYAIATDAHIKPALFPTSYVEGIHYAEPNDSYLTMMNPGHSKPQQEMIQHHTHHQHDKNCVRFEGRRVSRKRLTGLENSITSLHSSGKDSGIVDSAVEVMGRCQCGHSSTHSSEESSNSSYEDSLKSVAHRKTKDTPLRRITSLRRVTNMNTRLRNRSFPDDMIQESSMVRRVPRHHSSMDRLATPSNHAGISNRSSGRLMMNCHLNT